MAVWIGRELLHLDAAFEVKWITGKMICERWGIERFSRTVVVGVVIDVSVVDIRADHQVRRVDERVIVGSQNID